jgi:WD40 repeat protein
MIVHKTGSFVAFVFRTLLILCGLSYCSFAQTNEDSSPQLDLQLGLGRPSSYALTEDHRLLATGAAATITIWNIQTGRALYTLSGAGGRIDTLCFSKDSRFLAAGTSIGSGLENRIVVWDLSAKPPVSTVIFEGSKNRGNLTVPRVFPPVALTFSPDSRFLVGGGKLLDLGDLHVWERATGKDISKTVMSYDYPSSVAVAPSGGMIAIGYSRGDVKISTYSFPNKKLEQVRIGTLTSAVTNVAFNPAGNSLLASDGKTVKLLSIPDGTERCNLSTTNAWFEEERLIAIDSSHVAHRYAVQEPAGACRELTNGDTPSTRSLFAFWDASAGDLSVFSVKDGTRQWTVGDANVTYTSESTVDPRNSLLAVATPSGTRIFDLLTGEPRFVLPPADSVTFTPINGLKRLVATKKIDDSAGIHIWDTNSGQELTTVPNSASVYSSKISFSANGRLVVTPADDTLTITDIENIQESTSIYAPLSRAVCFNPILEKQLATANFESVHLIDGHKGNDQALNGPHVSMNDLKFNSTGEFLAGAGQDGGVYLWRVSDRKFIGRLAARASKVMSVAFNPKDAGVIAFGSEDGTVTLATAEGSRPLLGHTAAVTSLMFTADGTLLISGSKDATTRIWAVDDGKEVLKVVSVLSARDWLVVSPEGLFDGSADAMRQVGWRLGESNEVVSLEAFYNDYFHPGLLAEIFAGKRPKPPVDIATKLQFSGLRTMMKRGLAHLEYDDGKTFLCLSQEAAPGSGNEPGVYRSGEPFVSGTEGFRKDPSNVSCAYRKELIPAGEDWELLSSTSSGKTKKSDAEGSQKRPISDTADSTLHVFTVGIGEYEPAVRYLMSQSFKRLPFAASDADEVENFFKNQAADANKAFASIHVWPGLRDSQASLKAIREQLTALAGKIKKEDVVFLFFSGHGRVVPGQEMFYFIPYLPKPDDPLHADAVDERDIGLNTAMLAEAIRAFPARRIVLVMDACQSGGAVESLEKIGKIKQAVEKQRVKQESILLNAPERDAPGGVYILTAATPIQEAIATDKLQHGVLTTALLEALRDNPTIINGNILIDTVLRQVRKRVPELAKQQGDWLQTAFDVAVGDYDFPIASKQQQTQESKATK